MTSKNYIRSITEIIPDEIPSLTPLPETPSTSTDNGFFSNISFSTWIIIILILALLGINIFAYLAKGTQETASIISKIFTPIMSLFGYTTITTTEQTIQTGATGAKAGVDIVADTALSTIDTIKDQQGKNLQGEKINTNEDQYFEKDSLEKALDNATQTNDVKPDDSRSSIQTTGKSGWCYIGEEKGIRTCAEIGVNDVCMSGDVFPNQAICMNPNLRV